MHALARVLIKPPTTVSWGRQNDINAPTDIMVIIPLFPLGFSLLCLLFVEI